MDCSLPGSSVHGISQERIWSEFPTPEDLPEKGIQPTSLESPALAGGFLSTAPPGVAIKIKVKFNANKITKTWNQGRIRPLLLMP